MEGAVDLVCMVCFLFVRADFLNTPWLSLLSPVAFATIVSPVSVENQRGGTFGGLYELCDPEEGQKGLISEDVFRSLSDRMACNNGLRSMVSLVSWSSLCIFRSFP